MSRVGRDLSISSTDRAWSRQVALIWIISGTQGVGKTTVSRRLAETFDRSVHLEGDRLRRMIVRGERGVAMANWDPVSHRFDDETERQLELRYQNDALLARSYHEAGFTPVIDDVVIGHWVEWLRNKLEPSPVIFVMLEAQRDVLEARETERGTALFREWDWLAAEIRVRTPHVGLWLDNSDWTPEQTVAEILRRGPVDGLLSHPR
jgi:broad-specificity NMP kinase